MTTERIIQYDGKIDFYNLQLMQLTESDITSETTDNQVSKKLIDKDGNITLDNQKGQIKLDNQGQITIKNNQAMLNIDQTGLFSIQNIAQTMSLFTILNVDLVKVLTNLTPSSGAFAQALAQYKQDISKLLK